MSTVFIRENSLVRIKRPGSVWEGDTGRVTQIDSLCQPRYLLVVFPDGDDKEIDCWFIETEVEEVVSTDMRAVRRNTESTQREGPLDNDIPWNVPSASVQI